MQNFSNSHQIRKATNDDYDHIWNLHECLFRSHIEQIWGWHDDWQQENFAKNWSSSETSVIVSQEKIIGYLQIVREPDHIFLKNLGLHPLFQNQGIGQRVMNYLMKMAQSFKVPIKLSVFKTNPRAERFYMQLGFKKDEKVGQFQNMIWRYPSNGK